METAGSDRVSSFSEVPSHTSGTVSIDDNIFRFHVSNFKDQENHTLHCPIHLEVPVDSNYLGLPLCVPICNKVLATATLNIKIYQAPPGPLCYMYSPVIVAAAVV